MEKKELKDFIGTEVENFFDAITAEVSELVKYESLFKTESSREYYLGIVDELYKFLIKQSRISLVDYYQKEIKDIFSEKIPPLQKPEKISKTIENTKTWEPANETEES